MVKINQHFIDRWNERGLAHIDGEKLFLRIVKARIDGDETVLAHCKTLPDCSFWVCRVDGVRFYPIFKGLSAAPATIYTHKQYRKKMWAHKNRRTRPQHLRTSGRKAGGKL